MCSKINAWKFIENSAQTPDGIPYSVLLQILRWKKHPDES